MYIAARNCRDLFEFAEAKLWNGKGYIDLMWKEYTDELVPWEVIQEERSNGFDIRIRAEAKFPEDRLINGIGFGANTAASSDAVLICSYNWCIRKRIYDLRKVRFSSLSQPE